VNDGGLVIDERFHGPSGSGNGGYVCGRVAAYVDGLAEVTLRLPPPLGRPLRVSRTGTDVHVLDGQALVAEAAPASVELTPPPPVDLAAATDAARRYLGLSAHPFPTCFVCGPYRADGLRLTPGLVDGRDLVAAPWTPGADLGDAAGVVRDEFVWSALDCPGAWAFDVGPGRPMMLGRLAARLDTPLRTGQPYVVVGWPIAVDGRKLYSGTAVYDDAGAVCAVARATWIAIPAQTSG
jgi:hypothetical protein